MGKIAFVFAGQGAQTTGMGQSLFQGSAAARAVFQAADGLRPGTAQQCFYGTEDVLRETRNTQPCLFTVELAAAAALAEAGIRADMTAGFSLGELAAIAYAGAADFQTVFRCVMERGLLMQQAAEQHPAAMAAVLGLAAETVTALTASYARVYPVNFNCPGQVSVAGAAEEMPAFCRAVKAAGGKAVPLKVSGAFHSPFMCAAAAQFRHTLDSAAFQQPEIPLYADCTGAPYGEDVREQLACQMDQPVYWEKLVRGMIASGADTFLELGPGKTLSGMIKRIDAGVRTICVSEYADIQTVLQEVNVC